MSIKSTTFDLLGSHKYSQTPFWLTLIGFRKTIAKHMGLKDAPLIADDYTRSVIDKDQGENYPYGYFRITDFDIIKERSNLKAIGRHSSSITIDTVTDATIDKGFLFPCTIGIEFHFLHNDPRETLFVIEKTKIVGALDKFSFKCEFPGISSMTVGVMLEEGPVSFPSAVREDVDNPSALDVTFNFRINTHCGLVKSVPKINRDGAVTKTYKIGKPDEELNQ